MSQRAMRPVQDRAIPLPVSSEPLSELSLLCFSHLRWDFVYQRPQHLMSRFAKSRHVYFFEEPIVGNGPARLEVTMREEGVRVVVPHIPDNLDSPEIVRVLQQQISVFLRQEGLTRFVTWYYTPMALTWTQHLHPTAVIYDCMDELSLFRGAPEAMVARERDLLERTDIVFTGGTSLFRAKCDKHSNVHCFPSSVDYTHFTPGRMAQQDPVDQAGIPHVRLGFAGVIDERMDTALLDAIATAHPEWQLILIGPVVKIEPGQLPRHPNIHYLGSKPYAELPRYMAGWDVALMPFAKNEATRFISPTKTPEYLAAGRAVVSTSIQDVVHPYGTADLVEIADTPADFCTAIQQILNRSDAEHRQWLTCVDGFLSTMSWDRTYDGMSKLIAKFVQGRGDKSMPETAYELESDSLHDLPSNHYQLPTWQRAAGSAMDKSGMSRNV